MMLFFTRTSYWFCRRKGAGPRLELAKGLPGAVERRMPAPCLAGSPWGRVTRWIVTMVTLGALCPGGAPGAPCEEVTSEPRAEWSREGGCDTQAPASPGSSLCCRGGSSEAEVLELLPSLLQG